MRALLCLSAALGGLVLGVAALAVHPTWWGLPLAVAAPLAALLALPPGWSTRVAAAAGFALVVAVAIPGRPEGDFLIGGDVPGYTLLIATLVLVVAALVSAPVRRRRPVDAEPGPDPS